MLCVSVFFFLQKMGLCQRVWMYSAVLLPWLKTLPGQSNIENAKQWMEAIKEQEQTFSSTLKWLSCFALAVNKKMPITAG